MIITIVAVIVGLAIGFILIDRWDKRGRAELEEIQQKMKLDNSRERIINMINVRRKTSEIATHHAQELARRRMELVRPDAYGIVNWTVWQKELNSFTNSIIKPHLTSNEGRFIKIAKRTIDDIARIKAQDLLAVRSVDGMSPREFEEWCANTLSKAGWITRTTVATGDQGADVVASKGEVTSILQCKLYTSPVGNKAVQEAFAAQRHYGARVAAVVTNATFTKSARDLAASTGVLLLHYSTLSRFDEAIERSETAEIPSS